MSASCIRQAYKSDCYHYSDVSSWPGIQLFFVLSTKTAGRFRTATVSRFLKHRDSRVPIRLVPQSGIFGTFFEPNNWALDEESVSAICVNSVNSFKILVANDVQLLIISKTSQVCMTRRSLGPVRSLGRPWLSDAGNFGEIKTCRYSWQCSE